MKIGFDNEKYLKMQSEHIRDRINQFDNKLYLEFGGKLFDDFHASRVLPGFAPDAKLRMLMQLSDQAEIVMAISAADIEKNKIRGDLGITYDSDVLRLIDEFRGRGLYVGSVVITQYSGQHSADAFKKRLQKLGIPVYIHYTIPGYPHNVPLIVSDEGYGKNEYIETTRPLVVVTAPGPGSGKMATCLSQLYHEHKRGVNAGYAKYETLPIWNLPLKHPVNLAYEAATADLNDVNSHNTRTNNFCNISGRVHTKCNDCGKDTVSSMGVTGMRNEIKTDLQSIVSHIKSVTDVPVAIGFGINKPQQAKEFSAYADGVIVGSAIVNIVAEHGKDAPEYVFDYVKSMKDAIR